MSDVTLLLVDDDQLDQEMMKRSFRKQGFDNPIRTAEDGVAALELLRGTGEETQLEQPYIILLDINMPRMSGHEFLAEIRDDPQLANSIVFMLTTSNDRRDRVEAYSRQVAGYFVKPYAGTELKQLVEVIGRFSDMVEYPPEAA